MSLRPFWGAERPDLYDILQRTTDPHGIIARAVYELCPWEDRVVLDVGCGRGDFSARMARTAGCVVAVDADARMTEAARRFLGAGASRTAVLQADVQDLPFAAGAFDSAYALWSYFFGSGAGPGLRECRRVLRPEGSLCVVQNNGRDELSQLWSDHELRCLQWPEWFDWHGFSRRIIETEWRFPSLDEGTALVRYLWGESSVRRLLRARSLTFSFKVSLYHRRMGTPAGADSPSA